MLDLQNRKVIQIAAGVALIMLVYRGYEIRNGYLQLAATQQTTVDQLNRFSQQVEAVKESRKKWDKQYPPISAIHGPDGLIEHVKFESYGLEVDPDKVTLLPTEMVMVDGAENTPIGLLSTCLSTAGSGDKDVLEVSAPSYQALMTGIDKLSRRPDIAVGNISVKKGTGKTPVGRLGGFCVLLRSE